MEEVAACSTYVVEVACVAEGCDCLGDLEGGHGSTIRRHVSFV